ncbi:UDP-glucuronic acid decarboxylase family protein [Vibrio sp. WXL103]|uniref:UDP-glucuronic acid decarboxylase family protein n=1 Tax=Vibrio sp. WXL103 TaxID=3450710 RepID=UPI003EC819D0
MIKTIVITGGAGFIGSHLCRYLLSFGNRVICIDNFYTGKKSNINSLLSNDNFILIEHDIVNPISINEEVDEIYNLACPASPEKYQADPIKTTEVNVLGMLNVLRFALEVNAKVVHASTSEVYGDPDQHPQHETYWGNVNPNGIRSCYDEGKRCAESLCFDYQRKYGLETKVARIFNTYGPFMDKHDGRVVSNFINQAIEGTDITVFGTGSQTRSLCYVEDLVRGLISLMKHSNSIQTPVNLGNPKEITVLELAKYIKRLTNSKSSIVYKQLPSDDPRKRKPCIEKAISILGWEPNIDLETGIKSTISYFEQLASESSHIVALEE